MRKMFSLALMVVMMVTLFSVTAFAADKAVAYYDENGNPITVNGMYYNSQGSPMYNASCYYLDADGNPIYVGGCRAYYYDQNGDLTAGSYYYDKSGNAVPRPDSYPGGYGYGMWHYNTQGAIVNQVTYYDDFGNPVDPPANTQPPMNRGGYYGSCCGRW